MQTITTIKQDLLALAAVSSMALMSIVYNPISIPPPTFEMSKITEGEIQVLNDSTVVVRIPDLR